MATGILLRQPNRHPPRNSPPSLRPFRNPPSQPPLCNQSSVPPLPLTGAGTSTELISSKFEDMESSHSRTTILLSDQHR